MENKFFEQMNARRMGLIVSLPRNDAELAWAASQGGADAMKVHINVRHAASGTQFGSFQEEKENIAAIIAATSAPLGIMPGAGEVASTDELGELRDMGARFYDIYLQHMPVSYLGVDGLEGMPALGEGFRPGVVMMLPKWGFRMLEMSSVPHGEYGGPLTLNDLLDYAAVCAAFPGIVVVPTQKAIDPGDVAALADAGVRALMIGKIVAGDTAASIGAATEAFRAAIDRLG